MPFQTATNQTPAPAVAGDFSSQNPRSTVAAGPGGLVAGVNGVICGRFVWRDAATASVVNNFGSGVPNGLVANTHTALITQFLGETSYTVPAGYQINAFRTVDMWVKNDSANNVVLGQKVYANNATGQASFFGATASAPNGGTSTASAIAAGTASVTASIAVVPSQTGPGTNPGVMTVTVVGSGVIVPGGTLSGTGVQTGTMVVAQLSGTTGGVGTYSVNIPQTVASTTISETYGTLTVGGTVTGTFVVGDAISGANVTAGSYIAALGTGTGGAGTYIVSPTQTAASAAVNAQSATETDWFVQSYGAPGELIKITNSVKG